VALPREGSLTSEAIAAALDTGHALGPAFQRIEEEADMPTLGDALSLAGTDYARERLCILLAHHENVTKAVGVLPLLRGFLDASDRQLRRSAAYVIGTIAGRAGRARARAADPDLPAVLRERFSVEEDESVRDDLEAAVGAFGEPPAEPRHGRPEQFTHAVRRWLDFLTDEHGFEEPTVEDRSFSTTVTYRNDTTAVVASADWRDCVVDVFLVELREGALPLSLDGKSHAHRTVIFAVGSFVLLIREHRTSLEVVAATGASAAAASRCIVSSGSAHRGPLRPLPCDGSAGIRECPLFTPGSGPLMARCRVRFSMTGR
jgi:hypothetical protein